MPLGRRTSVKREKRLRGVTSESVSSQQRCCRTEGALASRFASRRRANANEPPPALPVSACDRVDFVPAQLAVPSFASERCTPSPPPSTFGARTRPFPAELVAARRNHLLRPCFRLPWRAGLESRGDAVDSPQLASLGRPPPTSSRLPSLFLLLPFPLLPLFFFFLMLVFVASSSTEARAGARRRVTRAHPRVSYFAEEIAQSGRWCSRGCGRALAALEQARPWLFERHPGSGTSLPARPLFLLLR